MSKSPQAFRTISEIATELDVPQHVLRFWEAKFTQIKPLRRGGGRRYYRPEDVDLIRGIRRLLYNEGYTIKGVQKVLREQGIRSVADSARDVSPGPVVTAEAGAPATDSPEPDTSAAVETTPPVSGVTPVAGLGDPAVLEALEGLRAELEAAHALLAKHLHP